MGLRASAKKFLLGGQQGMSIRLQLLKMNTPLCGTVIKLGGKSDFQRLPLQAVLAAPESIGLGEIDSSRLRWKEFKAPGWDGVSSAALGCGVRSIIRLQMVRPTHATPF